MNASISGAEVGCQGERRGSHARWPRQALCGRCGGSNEQIENAAKSAWSIISA